MVLFKQVFYTVSFDPPSHAGAVFHPSVTLDDVRSQMSRDAPPAYVSSVDYGRILMLRIETSTDTQHAEIEGALKYLSAQVKASADYRKDAREEQGHLDHDRRQCRGEHPRRGCDPHRGPSRGDPGQERAVLEEQPGPADRLHGPLPEGRSSRQDGILHGLHRGESTSATRTAGSASSTPVPMLRSSS